MAVDHNNPQSRTEEILIATIDGEEYDKLPQSRLEELLLELKQVIEAGGGGGGTTNYNNLSNKPQVNGITLSGDKSASDLSLVLAEVGKGLSTNDYSDEEKAKVANLLTAIEGILTGSDIDSFGDVETALSAIKDGSELDSFGDVEVALLDKADTSDLGTAAAKDSTNSVTAGSTDLVESGAVKDAIDSAVSKCYHHAGTKTCAELLPALLIAANEGNVYEMTDSGTTTSDFMEGIGHPIKEGDNVGVAKIGDGVYKFDLLSGFVDTTNFVQKSQTAGLMKNDGTIDTETLDDVSDLKSDKANTDIVAADFNAESSYTAGNYCVENGKLYKFKNNHSGAWSASDVEEVKIAGELSTLKSGLTNLDDEVNGDATTYPYADVITIEDAVPSNLADCKVKIEPVQSGSGDPSPTNVRPISGHTEASVEVTDGDETTNTYTIALGDTIYGGTVDFDSGVMTVDRAIAEFDGGEDESWTEYIGSNYRQYSLTISGSVDKSYVCNILPSITVDERETKSGVAYKTSEFDSLLRVCLLDSDGYNIASVADFKAFLAVNNMQLIYELATSTTIQLTPQQIQLLKGQNTLTASTGQISVTVNGVSGAIGAVQEQVNELGEDVALKQNATDNNLQTTDKTVVGAVNELKSGLVNKCPFKAAADNTNPIVMPNVAFCILIWVGGAAQPNIAEMYLYNGFNQSLQTVVGGATPKITPVYNGTNDTITFNFETGIMAVIG